MSLTSPGKEFFYHPNYLSNDIHHKTGKTFQENLLEMRMNRAEILLQETDLSVEEISWLLGYEDPSNFYRNDKAYFHISPRGEKEKKDWMLSSGKAI